MRDLIKEIENEDTERLQKLYDAVGETIGDASYAIYKEIQDVLERRKKEERKPKGIDVVMSCGEIYHIATDQLTIEKVRINGDQIYPSPNTRDPETYHDFAKLFSRITGEKWNFTGWGTVDFWEIEGKHDHKHRRLSEHFVIPWAGKAGHGYSRFIKSK